jgi:hypothetical protein
MNEVGYGRRVTREIEAVLVAEISSGRLAVM